MRPLPTRPADLARSALTISCAVALAACSVPPRGVDDTGSLDTDLPREAHAGIAGVVTDAEGALVAGAHVVSRPHGYEATTGADGAYALRRLPPGTYEVVVAAPGFAAARIDGIGAVAGEVAVVDVALEPAPARDGFLDLVVTGPTGEPVVGAIVSVDGAVAATTGADGLARLADLAGQTVDLSVADPTGDLWPRGLSQIEVPLVGNRALYAELAGRAPPGATWMGTATCTVCHGAVAATHVGSAHAHALRPAVEGDLLARFTAAETVDLGGPSAALSLPGGVPTVTLSPAGDGPPVVVTVSGVLGAGVNGQVPYARIGDQSFPLPFAWAAPEADTAPWPDRAAALVPYQPDRWFAPSGALALSEGRPAPARSAEAECLYCHVTGFEAAPREDGGVTFTGGAAGWLEPGVGCERCHGPGGGHLADGVARARFNITNPARLDADRAIEVCAQCHAATTGDGTGLPFPLAASGPFHPGAALADHAGSAADLWPAGVAAGPGQQADEHLASPHWTPGGYGMQCHDCHDPHAAATDAGGAPMPAQLRLDHRDNGLCLSCHASRTFAGSARAIEAHDGHVFEEDPAGPTHRGRCTGCHMPPVAARVRIAASSGAGDLASHGFVALPPRHTLDEFDARGASTLPLGAFPAHSCGECHAYNRWLTESEGFLFLPASGDPTLRASHEAYQAAFELKFP